MRKYYLPFIAMGLAMTAYAQDDYVVPVEVEDMVVQRVSSNGKYIAGQDTFGSVVYCYDVENGESTIFTEYCIGNGNCIADNGMIVGQSIGGVEMHAAVMYNGKAYIPQTLANIGISTLDAITPDGTRACGYRSATGSIPSIPFIVDIDANGNFGLPINLPYPRKDFFGYAPQFVTAVSISDDGKRIVGYVQDASGFFGWPIVYTQDENDKWSYSQPTEALFNPDNLPLPKDPDSSIVWGVNGAPAQPNIRDYMTQEEIQEYNDALKAGLNPNIFDYVSKEAYQRYQDAIKKFNQDADQYLAKKYDEYWSQMKKVGYNEQFLENIVMVSKNGKYMAAVQGLSYDMTAAGNIMDEYRSVLFNLEDGTFEFFPYSSKENQIVVKEVWNDGTIVGCSTKNDFIPFVTYLKMAGEEEFITFNQFLEMNIPSYLPWLEDSDLTQYGIIGYDDQGEPIYGDYTITGYVSFSNNLTTIAGGVPLDMGYSYIYHNAEGYPEVGVGEITMDPTEEALYNVFTLSGVKVLTTKDADMLKSLPKGLYIVNGKKVVL